MADAPAPAALFVYLSYRDPAAAIDWLAALGFETVVRQDDEEVGVAHAELKLGDAVVMLAGYDQDYEQPPLKNVSTGRGTYLHVDDVAAMHAKALSAGAREVFAPESTEWGTQRSRVLDSEGNEWSFGTYRPGQGW